MLLIDRLFEKSNKGDLFYGTVVEVKKTKGRVKVRTKSNLLMWIAYSPTTFPSIAVNNTVAIGQSGGSMFVLAEIPAEMPSSSTVLEV